MTPFLERIRRWAEVAPDRVAHRSGERQLTYGELVARAGVLDGEAIISTISLASEAGLVGGAFAPLIGGAHLIWQAPFAARRFLETLETSAPAHLVACHLREAPADGADVASASRSVDTLRGKNAPKGDVANG